MNITKQPTIPIGKGANDCRDYEGRKLGLVSVGKRPCQVFRLNYHGARDYAEQYLREIIKAKVRIEEGKLHAPKDSLVNYYNYSERIGRDYSLRRHGL